jgi:hypothetical protein
MDRRYCTGAPEAPVRERRPPQRAVVFGAGVQRVPELEEDERRERHGDGYGFLDAAVGHREHAERPGGHDRTEEQQAGDPAGREYRCAEAEWAAAHHAGLRRIHGEGHRGRAVRDEVDEQHLQRRERRRQTRQPRHHDREDRREVLASWNRNERDDAGRDRLSCCTARTMVAVVVRAPDLRLPSPAP